MYAGAPHVCRVHGGKKRALDPLELELQLVVSYHVGAGVQKEPVSSAREANSLLYWPFSPAPFADIAWFSEELGGSRTQTTWRQLRIHVHVSSWPPLSTCKLNDFEKLSIKQCPAFHIQNQSGTTISGCHEDTLENTYKASSQ